MRYHRALPGDIRRYLNGRGIPDEIIDRQLLGWTGRRVAIPVFGREGEVLFFRYGKSSEDRSTSPKMLSDIGAETDLYGWESLVRRPYRVVIAEGEYDRLVLEAHGFPAVTSTGGAGGFRPEWAPYFEAVRRIYICFDRDEAGDAGARKVKAILPKATVVKLPAEVGDKGDVTDYFVRLGKSRVDFELLLAEAASDADRGEGTESGRAKGPRHALPPSGHKSVSRRAESLKSAIPIKTFIEQYTDLEKRGRHFVGLCPFHEETAPSFIVYPDTGTYYCFGCRAHGDLVAFVMNKESLTFGQALESLERFRQIDDLPRSA